MKILNDQKTWEEIADILAAIQNGAETKYSELQGIEKAFIAQETDAILVIVALKIFPKYLKKMKDDLNPNPQEK